MRGDRAGEKGRVKNRPCDATSVRGKEAVRSVGKREGIS